MVNSFFLLLLLVVSACIFCLVHSILWLNKDPESFFNFAFKGRCHPNDSMSGYVPIYYFFSGFGLFLLVSFGFYNLVTSFIYPFRDLFDVSKLSVPIGASGALLGYVGGAIYIEFIDKYAFLFVAKLITEDENRLLYRLMGLANDPVALQEERDRIQGIMLELNGKAVLEADELPPSESVKIEPYRRLVRGADELLKEIKAMEKNK